MQGGCGEGGQGGPHSHQALTCLASSRVVSVHVRGPRPKQGCSALGAPGGVWAAGSEAGQHPCARSRSLRSGGTAPAGGRVLPGPSSLGAAAWSPHPPPRPWLPGRGGDAGGTVRCQANGPRGGDANVWDLHEQVPVLNVPLFPGGGRGAAGSRVRHAPLEPTPILRGTGRIQPGHPSPRPPGKGLGVGSALQVTPSPSASLGPGPPSLRCSSRRCGPSPHRTLRGLPGTGVGSDPGGSLRVHRPPPPQVPPSLRPHMPHPGPRAAKPLLPSAPLPSCPGGGRPTPAPTRELTAGGTYLPAFFPAPRHAATRQGAGGGCPRNGRPGASSAPPPPRPLARPLGSQYHDQGGAGTTLGPAWPPGLLWPKPGR